MACYQITTNSPCTGNHSWLAHGFTSSETRIHWAVFLPSRFFVTFSNLFPTSSSVFQCVQTPLCLCMCPERYVQAGASLGACLGAQMLEFAVGGALSEPGKSHHLKVWLVWVQISKPKGHFFFLLEYYVECMRMPTGLFFPEAPQTGGEGNCDLMEEEAERWKF